MNRQIRKFGIVMVVLYIALFAQLNWLQVAKASSYNKSPYNTRETVRDFSQPRGDILTADGVIVAHSAPSNDKLKYQRVYPRGDLYAHTAGFFSLSYGTDGVEHQYNDWLAGRTDAQKFIDPARLFSTNDRTADVTLTLNDKLQQVAKDSLGSHRGSVVAIDPRTGAVLAMYSNPSYDPTSLASHDLNAVRAARAQLLAAPSKPLLAKSYRERYFPGSTFKVVTSTAGLTTGKVTIATPVYPNSAAYTPPLTTLPIKNFGGITCGGSLFSILAVSCNTAFAQMGVEIGGDAMTTTAELFGFNSAAPIDLPNPAASRFPAAKEFIQDTPKLAQSAIGQNDVQATPLEMALVACAVANDGVIMAPHVVSKVADKHGHSFNVTSIRPWKTAMSPTTARTMRDAMIGVVQNGTAYRMAIDGVAVAGKTGTAELGTTPPSSHAWTIGFAGDPGNARIAVAVIVEAQPGNDEQTGGKVASPIVRAIIEAALALPDSVTKP